MPTLRVSVNLSASQFRDSGLVDTIRSALDDAGLEARYLEVELTESAVMSDPEKSIAILEHLSAMGVLVSVDDFGTGYSSMSYLRRFPIDKLKIDRVFIDEIVSRPEDASIVRAIVSLAHSLRLKVVAEGVETPAQLDFLKTAGCDEYQGYHFSRPLPAAEFERAHPRVARRRHPHRRRRRAHPQQAGGVRAQAKLGRDSGQLPTLLQLGAIRIHSQARHLAALQLLLHVLPILHAHADPNSPRGNSGAHRRS